MKILIADQRELTRFVLRQLLLEWGDYHVLEASNGQCAWQIINQDSPRIVILDWMLPQLDGVTICKQLQERKDQPLVYTILLTDRNESKDMVYALANGVHNFQSKPISPDEFKSHVAVGRRLVETDDKLNHYAERMEALAEERARQLVHADRLASLGTLAAGITHEINSPLTYVLGQAQIIEYYWKEISTYVGKHLESDHNKTIHKIMHDIPTSIKAIIEGGRRISTIVKGMKNFSRKDNCDRFPLDIHQCIQNALQLCNNAIKYKIEVITAYAEDIPLILINSQQIEQVFVNLISNAVDSMESCKKGNLKITTKIDAHHLYIIFEDNGPGISREKLNHIWEPFYTTKPSGKGTGLGLSISRGIIKDHDGTISSENTASGGACFTIRLPLKSGIKS